MATHARMRTRTHTHTHTCIHTFIHSFILQSQKAITRQLDMKQATVVQHTVTGKTIHKMTHINSNHITEYQTYNAISNNLNKKTVNNKSQSTIKYIK